MACQNCACGPPVEMDPKFANVAEHPEADICAVDRHADEEKLKRDAMTDEEKLRQAAMKAAGAQLIDGGWGSKGLRISGWRIESRKRPILKMDARDRWEKMLGTIHLPEMVFGDNSLELVHEATGIKLQFNALDALRGWRQESLPPVEVPAAAKWKFRTKPNQELILDYDYTFTTPYSGSQCVELKEGQNLASGVVEWVESQERIDMAALQARDPILFFDEVVLYEDELADNGVALLTVKVRVMPTCWFLLLRFWLRVDGVLMRLRETRMCCRFQSDPTTVPLIIRESTNKEETFQALSSRGFANDYDIYNDPSLAGERLQQQRQICEKLKLKSSPK